MNIRTPNNIEVLLHCYTQSFEPHPRHDAEAVLSALDLFIYSGLIYKTGEKLYCVTPKGAKVVEALCEVQI